MALTDSLGLLAIIIALAAYVAVVRHRIIDAKRERGPDNKLLRASGALVLADFPLVIAGLLLAADITIRQLARLEAAKPGTLRFGAGAFVSWLFTMPIPPSTTYEPPATWLFWIAGALFLLVVMWMGFLHLAEAAQGFRDGWKWLRGATGGGIGQLLAVSSQVLTVDHSGVIVYCGEGGRYYEFQALSAVPVVVKIWRKGASTHEEHPVTQTSRIAAEGVKIMLAAINPGTSTSVLSIGPKQ